MLVHHPYWILGQFLVVQLYLHMTSEVYWVQDHAGEIHAIAEQDSSCVHHIVTRARRLFGEGLSLAF